MNRSRFIGAIVCLVVSALLIVLSFALPSDEVVFMVGDTNRPFLPPLILGIVGLILLFTSGIGRRK